MNSGNDYSRFTTIVRQCEPLVKSIAAHFYAPGNYSFHALQVDLITYLWLLFRDRPSTTDILNKRAWIYTVIYHKALNMIRDEQRYQDRLVYGADLSDLPDDVQPNPQVDLLHSLINQLNESDRTVILMHIDGLSIDEIAEYLHKTKSQTYSRLHSIRNKLRRLSQQTNPDNL